MIPYTGTGWVWKLDHPVFLGLFDGFYDGDGFRLVGGPLFPCRFCGSGSELFRAIVSGPARGTPHRSRPGLSSKSGIHKKSNRTNDTESGAEQKFVAPPDLELAACRRLD